MNSNPINELKYKESIKIQYMNLNTKGIHKKEYIRRNTYKGILQKESN